MTEGVAMRTGRFLTVALVVAAYGGVPAWAQPGGEQKKPAEGPRAARHVGPSEDLKALVLVKVAADKAVVRFGRGPLELIAVGDRVGRTRGEVKEIAAGRLTLEEAYVGADGRPNRALVVLKEGEQGGQRYQARLEEPAPPAVRPQVIVPGGRPGKAKKEPPKAP